MFKHIKMNCETVSYSVVYDKNKAWFSLGAYYRVNMMCLRALACKTATLLCRSVFFCALVRVQGKHDNSCRGPEVTPDGMQCPDDKIIPGGGRILQRRSWQNRLQNTGTYVSWTPLKNKAPLIKQKRPGRCYLHGFINYWNRGTYKEPNQIIKPLAIPELLNY